MTKMYCSMAALWLMLAAGPAAAAGISVEQSYIRLADVDLKGATRLAKPAGHLLSINNPDGKPAVYIVSFLSCGSMGLKPNRGYEEFPDAGWLVFRSTEIAVPAGGRGYLPYLDIKAPKGDHAGRRWQLLVKVARAEKGFLGAEAVLPLWIETKPKKDPKKASGEEKYGK